jgi:hypothetical protein
MPNWSEMLAQIQQQNTPAPLNPGYQYSDFEREIIKRAQSGGKDPGRMATADKLAARAKAGDQAALQELIGLSQSNGGWATNDAVNYGRLKLRELGFNMQGLDEGGGYVEPRDGAFSLGKTLGGALKIAAPIAGALIPGVGWLGAAAIGGLGNAGGQLLQNGRVNVGQSLLSGALAGGGNALLGNGLGAGSSGMLGSAGQGAQALGGAASAGGAPAGLGPQGIMAPGGGAIGAVGTPGIASGGGVFGQLGGLFGGADGKFGLGDALGLFGTIGSGIHAANLQDEARDQRRAAIEGATNEWNSRAPLRQASQAGLLSAGNLQRPDFSQIFADPGNPFMAGRQAPLPFAGVG